MVDYAQSIEKYVIHKQIGKGGFGTVLHATCQRTHTEVAIKKIDKTSLGTKLLQRVRDEVEIHSKLDHPSVLKLLTFFEDDNYVYLILELCPNGELDAHKPYEEHTVRTYLTQIVHGMLYLHRHGIMHRDLTLRNILLDSKGNIKIADFGLAAQLRQPEERHTTLCGTPNYMSPEVAAKRSHGLEADVWSLGCLLYTMLVGKEPFNRNGTHLTLKNVVLGSYEVPTHVSANARDLIDRCLQKNPKSRILLKNIPTHPFLLPDPHREPSSRGPRTYASDSGLCTRSSNATSAHPQEEYFHRERAPEFLGPLYGNSPPVLMQSSKDTSNQHGKMFNQLKNKFIPFPFNKKEIIGFNPQSGDYYSAGYAPALPETSTRERDVSEERRKQKGGVGDLENDIDDVYNDCYADYRQGVRNYNEDDRYDKHGDIDRQGVRDYNEDGRYDKRGDIDRQGVRDYNDRQGVRDYNEDDRYDKRGDFDRQGVRDYNQDGRYDKHGDIDRRGEWGTRDDYKYDQHGVRDNRQGVKNCRNDGRYDNHADKDYKQGDRDYRIHGTDKRSICSDTRLHRQAKHPGVKTRSNSLEHLKKEQSHSIHCRCDECRKTGRRILDGIQPPVINQVVLDDRDKLGSGAVTPVEVPQPSRPSSRDGECLPLTSRRLRPMRQVTETVIFSILNDGKVCVEILKKGKGNRQKMVHDVCKISPNGLTIEYYKPNGNYGVPVSETPPEPQQKGKLDMFTFKNLPKKHWKKYRYASQFVNIVKEKTPKMTYYSDLAQCFLMENGPEADFEAKFYSGEKILIKKTGLEVTQENGRKSSAAESLRLIDGSERMAALYSHTIEIKEIVLQAEESLSALEVASDRPFFPAVFGRRPPSCGSPTGTEPQKRTSGKENVSPVSLPPSRMAQIGVYNDSLASLMSVKHVSDQRKPLSVSNQNSKNRIDKQLIQTQLNRHSHDVKGQGDYFWEKDEDKLIIKLVDGTNIEINDDGQVILTDSLKRKTVYRNSSDCSRIPTYQLDIIKRVLSDYGGGGKYQKMYTNRTSCHDSGSSGRALLPKYLR